MLALRLIERKRDGGRVDAGEWRALANAYATGHVPDYQMAAFLMACFLRGLDRTETNALTEAMLRSGEVLDLSSLGRPRIDKHSTGGVGDKVSIVLAPLIASLGVAVPMMSGRGLGHTGGTLDKLESIPGFRTDLSLADARKQLEMLNCALIGQTAEIAPADRKMYALRDATGTVESIPLIAASIMSKKLAEGLTGLVLDVKRGSGAFLPELERGLELARTMIELGADHHTPVVALITAMDRPLGRACGNALEVEESILALRGEGPPDLMSVTYALGAEMLVLGGVAKDHADGRERIVKVLGDGSALAVFRRADRDELAFGYATGPPDKVLPQAPQRDPLTLPAGRIVAIDSEALGIAALMLGAGRRTKEDAVDHAVGIVCHAKRGAEVAAGEMLAEVHARTEKDAESAAGEVLAAYELADTAPHERHVLLEVVD